MKLLRRTALGILGLLVTLGPASAQLPDKFTNLKVFPQDIGKRELVGTMREFAGALGVRCDHCHAPAKEGAEGLDFASDDLEPKRVARVMMKMTGEINDKLLPMTGRQSLTRVRCVTCHHGVTEPEPLDRLLSGLIGTAGVPAADKRYRELRQQYYGTGAYDFHWRTLNAVAERLAQEKNDVDGAIAIARLNLEFNADRGPCHAMLGQLLAAKGDREGAMASLRKALELDPQDERAKQALDKLQAPE